VVSLEFFIDIILLAAL